MLKQMEAQYELLCSVDEMLSPNVLSELTGHAITWATERPIENSGGVSGSQLSFVETDSGRYFMKRQSKDYDTIMVGSADLKCRSVTLWQYGILDQLRPIVEHKIIACACDGNGWAILMDDIHTGLFTQDRPFTSEYTLIFLDALAHIHASFWNNQRLADPELGLGDTSTLLETFSPLSAHRYAHYPTTPLPEWVIHGWDALPKLVEPKVYDQIRKLIEDPKPLVNAVARYPCTLTHGDYRSANIAHDGQTCIAFDWQLSAYSLMTVDLSWFVHREDVMNGIGVQEAIQIYRRCLETYLDKTFDDTQWQAMIDLGFCVDTLGRICFPAFFATEVESPESKNTLLRVVQSKALNVVSAIKWL